MKTHIRRAHPEFECVPTDGVPMERNLPQQIEVVEELQPAINAVVQQQDASLSTADDSIEPSADDSQYLLYNIRDQI